MEGPGPSWAGPVLMPLSRSRPGAELDRRAHGFPHRPVLASQGVEALPCGKEVP